MTPDRDSSISVEAYDKMAPDYEAITGAAIREHYEWPTVTSLLPAIEDASVLDAACGDGCYTERLVDRGATAVGVDASPDMVAHAQQRFDGDDRVSVYEADLTTGLSFLDDGAFDLVVCQLALEHIDDWRSVFTAFHRVLKPGGHVVISTSHPVRDYVDAAYSVRDHILADSAAYPEIERVHRDWGGEEEEFLVPFYRRPLQNVFGPPTDAGFLIERVVEPEVTAALAELEPEYAKMFQEDPPNFLCLRFRKPPAKSVNR